MTDDLADWLQKPEADDEDDGEDEFVDQDISTISPTDFSKFFSEQLLETFESQFYEIGEIWSTMGIGTKGRMKKILQMKQDLSEHVQSLLDSESNELNTLRNQNEYLLNEVNKILTALSLDPFQLPSSNPTNKLVSIRRLLRTEYRKLLTIKNDRIDQLSMISDKLKKTCHSLGMEYREPLFSTNIPSDPELANLRSRLMDQQRTLQNNRVQFESINEVLLKLVSKLEYHPYDDNERMLIESSAKTRGNNLHQNEFIFSQQNITLQMNFHKKLMKLYKSFETEIQQLKSTLETLYDRLDVEKRNRIYFDDNSLLSLPEIKQKLIEKIEEYEIIKKNSIEKITKSIRNDIRSMFEKCMVLEFDRTFITLDDFDEPLLIQHEIEYDNLVKFHQTYDCVLQKLVEWKESLERLIILESKSMDPNRFNNRGGTLLQDERDRRILTKKIPRLEREIRSLITVTESQSNIPIDHYGLDVEQYFSENRSLLQKKTSGATNSQTTTTRNNTEAKVRSSPVNKSPRTLGSNKVQGPSLSPIKSSAQTKRRLKVNCELDFQRLVNENDLLHSTALNVGGCDDPRSLMSRSPTMVIRSNRNLPLKKNRRLSRSCDDLTKLVLPSTKSRIRIPASNRTAASSASSTTTTTSSSGSKSNINKRQRVVS